ncbi:MAG: flavodoxin family protein, partial [Oscillospiraceae bacterium]|nr:flavodoxin family protein [Oscillospiraceae bacterium]
GEHPTAKERGRVVLLDTASTEHQQLSADIQKAKQHFEISGFDVEIITLRDYTFKHCTGCMACYSNRRCCIKDDWHDVFNRLYLNTDMIVYFGVLHHATLGSTYRTFVERHASLGRCGMDDGCIKTFMVYKDEMSTAEDFADFRICFQGFEGLLRSYLSDVIDLDDKECDFITALDKMTVAYNNDVMPQTTFLGISMTRAFASTASVLKYQCSGDYRYFEEKGLYREILPDSHAQWLDGLKEAVASSMGRLIPYRMKLQHTEGVPVVHDRRPYKALPNCGKTYRLCGCCP